MNIFYAPPSQIQARRIELRGQEAIHATKSLRYSRGDDITVVDGTGGWYEGEVQQIADESVLVAVEESRRSKQKRPKVSLGMGIIKKRNRLEFAVEKAVELGVKKITLFRGNHSEKQNIRRGRLQTIAISAMKQSLQAWLPEISFKKTLPELVQNHPSKQMYAARQGGAPISEIPVSDAPQGTLLLAGPEGGFSGGELQYLQERGAALVSLSRRRLRTETAVVALLSQYHSRLLSPMVC